MSKSPNLTPLQERSLTNARADIATVRTDGRWTDRRRVDHWEHMSRYYLGCAESDPGWADFYRTVAAEYDAAVASVQ